MEENNKIGLALSGGGYRAATYHIGTFRALRKLGVLDKIEVISTNSGGSIAGACYSLYHEDFNKFEKILVNGVQRSIIRKVIGNHRFYIPALLLISLFLISIYLLFTNYAWLNILIWPSLILLLGYAQFVVFPISKIIEKTYDDFFFKEKTLKDFSENFRTTINSTNLETGRVFHFSRDKMGDSKYEFRPPEEPIKFNPEHFPISRAVMASSCVPFAFTPVKVSQEYYIKKSHYKEISPRLVDGGIYDNQGIHKLTFPGSSSYCKNVIISDAGTELPFKKSYRNLIPLLIRTSDVFMTRIKNFQMINNLYRVPSKADCNVAYQSLGFDLTNSITEFMDMLKDGYLSKEVVKAHKIPNEWICWEEWEKIETFISKNIDIDRILINGCNDDEIKNARSVGTNLIPLTKEQTKALIKHAEVITELQVKLFLPHIL